MTEPEPASPADRYHAFLLDLDGVVYRGDAPVPGAAGAIEELRAGGRRVVFVTNNSARTPGQVAEKLRAVGVKAAPEEVVTSAQAVVPLLGGARTAFVVGEDGVRAALAEAGIEVLEGEPERADAVVVGWDRGADYARLRTASVLVRRGARLVATNADASYPAPGGELWPGAGALLAAVETAAGVRAAVAGKPHPPLFEAALARAGGGPALVVGDRIETDVAGALAAGLDAALVLTGAASPADLLDHDALPAVILPDLAGLLRPRPDARVRRADPHDEAHARLPALGAGLAEPAAEGSLTVVAGEEPLAAASVRVRGAVAYLHAVAVREDARGLGLGSLVVAAAAREARAGGAGTLYLCTEGAGGFFAGLGFEPTERARLPAWVLGLATACADSAVAMRRRISPTVT